MGMNSPPSSSPNINLFFFFFFFLESIQGNINVMWVVTKRKFTLAAFMLPYLVINATSLFFHDRRFETPATKKNHIEEWAQGLPPPQPFKKQRTSATDSTVTSSHTTSPK